MTEYTIRRSDRARRLRIVVAPEGVEVVLPRRMALREAEQFVAEKRPWIERTLRAYRAAERDLPPVRLETGGELPYLGFGLSLQVTVERWRTRSGVSRRGGTLHVGVPEAGEAAVRDALAYKRIEIRDQRTRWGSCSTRGTLSFNWRLVLAPYEVLDYVVVHEVCHIREPNHSRRFWKLVESRVADHREHERWLRRYGPALRTVL